MNRWTLGLCTLLFTTAMACGGSARDAASPAAGNATASAGSPGAAAKTDPAAQFAPLGVGSDWQTYTKSNTEPVMSLDHGKRFVDTYVNDVGKAAYHDPDELAEIPVGTVIVKTSWESKDGKPTTTPGPIFVMEKKAPGYDPENGDWYYAIHWENPTENMRKRFGGPIYWQSPSTKVAYCVNCHGGYDRQLGMVPEEHRSW